MCFRWAGELTCFHLIAVMGGWGIGALLCGAAVADEPAAPSAAEVLTQARTWVTQLGSSDFATREQATAQLARLGWPARAALEEGLKNPHPETRLRVRRILSLIREDDFQRAIAALLADDDGNAEHPLPLWPKFREDVGRDAAARELFVSMLRAEGSLLAEVAAQPRTAAGGLQRRCEQLQFESAAQDREIDQGSLAAVLYIASDERVPLAVGTDSLLYRFCSHSSIVQTLEARDAPTPLRKIVGTWVQTGRGGYYSLRLAMAYDMPEGLLAAGKMLDGKTEAYYRQYAILTFAKLGSKADIPRLEKVLDDVTLCSTHTVDDVTYVTQFRDIALAAVLHLHGADPREFGFTNIREHAQYVYSPYTIGFSNEVDRQAAFSKWAEFRRTAESQAADDADNGLGSE
jgi:hypothetical protein